MKQLASYGAVWCGVASAIIVFIVEIILCSKKIIFAGIEKKIEQARQKGNVIKGYRVNCRFNDRYPEEKTANRMWIASYKYELNGKEREYQVVSTSVEPSLSINLYYTNSKKVFSEYNVGKNPLQILLYIIPVLVAFVIMMLMGYNFKN